MWSALRDRWLLDRSVAYAVAARGWQFLAGGISLYLVARFLTPEVQGFYYAFASLLGTQIFFDLGLGAVLTYIASHEWAAAQDESVATSGMARRRLGELQVHSRRWYMLCALAFAVIVYLVGQWFFQNADSGVAWRMPWTVSVLLTSINLVLIPLLAILEGCNFVTAINGCRLVSGIAGNLAVWTVIVNGGGLWAIAVSALIRLLAESWLALVHFRSFFRRLAEAVVPGKSCLSWRSELLPLQWRVAVQNLVGYFALQAYTPIIFKYHGPVRGGQMGMTWSAITTIQLAAAAWIQNRVPQFGRLLAAGKHAEAKHYFRRAYTIALIVYALAAACFASLIGVLAAAWPALAARVLDIPTLLVFEIGMGLTLAANGLGIFVRTLKIDPFVRLGVSTSTLLGILVWWLGATVGAWGAGWAHVLVTGLIILPATYVIYRRTTSVP